MSLLRRFAVHLLLLSLIVTLLGPELAQAAPPAPFVGQPAVAAQALPPHTLYLPPDAAARGPLQVLVILHGMGGDGPSIAAPLRAQAEQLGLAVVAPTFAYGDWRDPNQVIRDDVTFLGQLKLLLDSLPSLTGLQFRQRALLYGFSRGGQMAHRFATFYPRATLGVASLSCGTYTLPYARALPDGRALSLAFPYGAADLQRYTGRAFDAEAFNQISFLVGVGARDNQPGDLPRQWDPYIGTNRVERAWSYYQALANLGLRAQVLVFPETSHAETDEMRARALEYLASLTG